MWKEWFRREELIGALKGFRVPRFKVSHSLLLRVSILSISLFLAFVVRLLPLRWARGALFNLSEFDPYFHYRSASYLLENGLSAWVSWRDTMRWYPFGHQVVRGSYPGLPITAAFLYVVSRALGLHITLLELCVIFPVITGTLTCLVIYFLCKDIGGEEAALFSSLFLALNSSYISRTSLGWFDDESVGIFSILLFFLFFLRSTEKERSLKNGLIYAVAAGLSLGYICTSWGASRYPIGVAALFVFVLILLRRYSPRLLFSYGVSFGVAFFIAVNVPKLGLRFLTETFNLPVPAVFLLLCLCEVLRRLRRPKTKTIVTLTFFALSLAALFVLSEYGFIKATPGKFWNVLNPFLRAEKPLVESVAEHRPSAWGTLYYEYGIGIFFIPVGLFFVVRNPTDRNIFLIIYALTTAYFAGSMIRLTLLLAPAFCILWAIALVRLSKPFITLMREPPAIPRRRRLFGTRVGKEFSAIPLIMMFLLLTFTLAMPRAESNWLPRSIYHAYTPTTIASSSTPVRGTATDWMETLTWMQNNLPPTAVVASWWDYGYWITVVANKTTLADNGTWNSTQIRQIALMFMSQETEAVKILKKYNATHVVVFTTCYPIRTAEGGGYMLMDRGWGDEGKWGWMAKIAGLNETDYGTRNVQSQTGVPYTEWTSLGKETVIYKLMTYPRDMMLYGGYSTITLRHFNLVHLSQGEPVGGILVLVCVYEIKY